MRKTMIGVLLCLVLLGCEQTSQTTERAGPVDPMSAFGTTASNVFFYYRDLDAATSFYRQVLGLRLVAEYGTANILQVAPKSFITLVDEKSGMHSADDPKTTAIALVTDQLDEWWEYIRTQEVDMRSTEYDPVAGRPHHGFVAIDPEGYLLEFERFNPHEENRNFMPVLERTRTLYAAPDSNVPEGLGFKATIVWFYYKDMDGIQRFYEDVMGFDMIVDQGWTKIYPIGPSGYLGLVDEQRGMHRYTEKKAVTLSLVTGDIDGWYGYLSKHPAIEMHSSELTDRERFRDFVAYDPEGYFLEWDDFKDVPVNRRLISALRGP
ncbi:MAG: VOC family protein [Woeseiaceae bacterium]|nr:VOC family protein [Woeseiaceae bacterium]